MRKISSKIKRKIRNRKKMKNVNNNKFRVTVFKSSKNISAQIIDDKIRKTLVSASSTEKNFKKNKIKKIEIKNVLGELLAKRAKKKSKMFTLIEEDTNIMEELKHLQIL